MFKTLVRSLALALCLGLPVAGSANAAVMDGLNSAGPMAVPVAPVEWPNTRWGGAKLLLVSQWLAGPWLYLVRLRLPTGYGWGGGYGWNGWGAGGGYRCGAGVCGGVVYRGGASIAAGYHGRRSGRRGGGYRGGGDTGVAAVIAAVADAVAEPTA